MHAVDAVYNGRFRVKYNNIIFIIMCAENETHRRREKETYIGPNILCSASLPARLANRIRRRFSLMVSPYNKNIIKFFFFYDCVSRLHARAGRVFVKRVFGVVRPSRNRVLLLQTTRVHNRILYECNNYTVGPLKTTDVLNLLLYTR